MLAQRNLHRHGAELRRVDHVAGERRPAADDLVARVERRLREGVDDPVRPGADRHLLVAHAEALRQRGAQPPGAAVRVAVQLRGRALDRLERRRKRPERPLVGGELDAALEPQLPLHLLDRLARLVRNEARTDGRKKLSAISETGRGHAGDCNRGREP